MNFDLSKLGKTASVLFLALAMAGCGGGNDAAPEPPAPTPVDMSGVTVGYMVAAGTVEIAAGHSTTVGDVTFSCAAGGADCTVMVAADGMAAYATEGGMVTAANSSAYQARLDMDAERTTVSTAISMAMTAVGGLTNMSSDEDVTAAQGLIDAAKEALAGVTGLSASEVLEFQTEIASAETDLGTAKMAISDYRTHQMQYSDAMGAVNDATTAVAGLSAMSSDADVTAAEMAIADAKTAVADGTMLTDAEVAMLNGQISTAEMDIGTAKMAIADFRTHAGQLMAANDAIDEATMAVDDLTAMSSDEDIAAAKKAITDAEALVSAGTMLTDGEVAALNGKIAIAKVDLGNMELAISGYRTHKMQYEDAMTKVGLAETAVDALDINSDNEAVTDAKTAIEAAEAAIEAGMTLTETEKAGLTGRITTVKATLMGVEEQIAIRKDGERAAEIVRLHEEASDATKDAMAAGDDAEQAVKDAVKYSGMLDVLSVKGDSYQAQMNAATVLRADERVDGAVAAAKAAKTKAETAKTNAEALADGTEGKAAVIEALDEAIKTAEAEIVATTAIDTGKNADKSVNTDGQALKTAVRVVTGADEDDPNTPTDIGEGVAMDVGGTLLATNANAGSLDGTPRRVTHYATVAALDAVTDRPAIKDRTFHDTDSAGNTWRDIVGEDNVAEERLGTIPDAGYTITTGNGVLPVALIAGMDADVVNPGADDLGPALGPNTDGQYVDAFSTDATDINYMGIPGVVICLGGTDGCSVGTSGANAGKLVGAWYFTPNSQTDVYIPNPDEDARDATPYVRDDGLVQWGHWIAADTTDTALFRIHTYAVSGANTANLDLGVDAGSETEFETASYKGDAAGMSVHKELDTNGKQLSISSGAFTAKVSLTARFGSEPTLKGTIDQFRSESGMNTDPGWSVALQERRLDTTSAAFTSIDGSTLGVAKGSGQGGDWTTQGFGPEQTPEDSTTTPATPAVNHRPTGFFGSFNAHFTDGHAAGVYSAREE